jgi:hypothetical protein
MESDLSLINRIKENRDENSLSELIDRHSGIYVYIVDQYSKHDYINNNKRSILDDKDYMIYKSALDFDPSRNSKFSTFLANQTKWKCLNEMNKKEKKDIPLEKVNINLSDDEDSFAKLSKIEAFDIFNSMLKEEKDERVKKIIDIRYDTSNTKLVPWKTAAKKLNLSIQGCINIHDKFIEKVKNKLDENYV